MIATALTFLFGVLVTALIALLVAPLVWRKAQSLARREYEATIPTSANEIRAEFDRVRAEAAMTVRRHEIIAREAREKSARTQAELGRTTVENVALLKRSRKLSESVEERQAEFARIGEELHGKDEEHKRLSKALAAARHEAELTAEELEALGRRFQDLGEIAEERKIQLIAAEAKHDRLSDQLRSAERATREAQATTEHLKADAGAFDRSTIQDRTATSALNDKVASLLAGIADRDEEIGRLKALVAVPGSTPPKAAAIPAVPAARTASRSVWGDPPSSPATTQEKPEAQTAGQRLRAALARKNGGADEAKAEAAEIREKISDIAARVIRMTALAEGAGSPIAALVDTPAGGNSGGAATAPSLAERVRMLVETEKAGAAAPASQRQGVIAGRE